MATKQITNQCIWCRRKPPSATFKSESHVLPECVGNERQQVLPQGIVCDDCNNYFGTKVEPTLIDDPIFKTVVGILQLRDENSEFVYEHSPSGVHRVVYIETKVSGNKVTVATQYKIKGQPSKPYDDRSIPPKSKDYDKRSLAFLSRAVHKIAFESLAHSLFVKNSVEIVNMKFEEIDVFDSRFNAIRRWVRYGEPQGSVRAVLRLQKIGEVKSQEELFEWKMLLYGFQHWLRCELDLFGDWYIVSLTSPSNKVDNDLKSWVKRTKFDHPVWIVGDKLQAIV